VLDHLHGLKDQYPATRGRRGTSKQQAARGLRETAFTRAFIDRYARAEALTYTTRIHVNVPII